MKTNILTIKEIANKLGVSLRKASQYNKDIKEHYKLRTKVTEHHFNNYFNLQ